MKLVIKNIVKSYDKKYVINGANFTFEKGKIYALLGRNGSGKTTLFNCINEDIEVDTGAFYLNENDVNAPLAIDDVGYVLSTPSVPSFLTAREFVKFFVDINKAKLTDTKTVDEYLDIIGIEEEDKDRLLKGFSLGMKNKMQMLVNFIARPKVFLLDEPLTSFDVVVAVEMKKFLLSINKVHIIIFSTHIMELAMELCDEVVILSEGVLTKAPKDKEAVIEILKRGASDE